MTELQYEKAQQKSFAVLEEQGIVVLKAIFPAYNLAKGFVDYVAQDGFTPNITEGFFYHNTIIVWTVDLHDFDGLYDAQNNLAYFLSEAYSAGAKSIVCI